MKNTRVKSALICLASFVAAALGMILIYYSDGIYPGSRRTMFAFDMRAQFSAFFASLRYIGSGDNSIFFNWSSTLGGNFIGTYAYYVASPLSWLINLFDLEHLSDGIWLLTVLKIGLCGLSFSYFLESEFRTQKGSLYTILFSCCYALMSYNMIYSVSLMWIDGVIFLPLILAGIERMLRGRGGILFVVSLTTLFYSSFYISYMVGIFAALYLGFRLFCIWNRENRRDCLRVMARFAVNSLLSIGLAAPLLVPTALSLRSGKIAAGQEAVEETFYFPIYQLFQKLLPTQFDSVSSAEDGLPSVYCGTVMVLLAVFYFLRRVSARRVRIGAAAGLVFLAVSFCTVELDHAWHGFQYPNGFPWRYAFLFSAILILIAVRGFEAMPLSSHLWKTVARICCAYTFAELFLNASVVTGDLDFQTYYTQRYEYLDVAEDTETLVSEVQGLDDGLYRMDKDYRFSLDDPALFGYNGIDSSSSIYNRKVLQFLDKTGLCVSDVVTELQNGSTLLTDSLLAVKYRMMRYPVTDEWTKLDQTGYTKLYRNDYALPIAFWTSAEAETSLPESDNPFEIQNAWLQALTGTDHTYYADAPFELTCEDGHITIVYTAQEDGPVYLRALGEKLPGWDKDDDDEEEDTAEIQDTLASENAESDTMTIDDGDASKLLIDGYDEGEYYFAENYGNIFLGDLAAGETVTVDILYDPEQVEPTENYLVRENTETLTADLEMLAENGLDVTSHSGGSLSGTVTAPADGYLFTSIPYDDGFTVLVDGEQVDYSSFDDTFLMIPVTAGTHTVELSYVSPGFYIGLLLCAVSVLVLITSALKCKMVLKNAESAPKMV